MPLDPAGITPTKSAGAAFRQWECQPSTTVCDDGANHYVQCTSDGRIADEMQCPLRCSPTVEKCVDLEPSYDTTSETTLAAQLDAAAGGAVVAFTGSSTINTDTAMVTNAGSSSQVLSQSTTVIDGKRVFWMKSLSIQGTLEISGQKPLVLLVDGDVSNQHGRGRQHRRDSCQGRRPGKFLSDGRKRWHVVGSHVGRDGRRERHRIAARRWWRWRSRGGAGEHHEWIVHAGCGLADPREVLGWLAADAPGSLARLATPAQDGAVEGWRGT